MADKVVKSEEDWQSLLTPEQFHVTRQKGTERAFAGEHYSGNVDGVYSCVCCGQELFDAGTQFDSGTGWPSFWAPIAEDRVATETDLRHGRVRTEVLCSRCDAHLGHVFDDGPTPTGLRYCMNSVSLRLVPRQ